MGFVVDDTMSWYLPHPHGTCMAPFLSDLHIGSTPTNFSLVYHTIYKAVCVTPMPR